MNTPVDDKEYAVRLAFCDGHAEGYEKGEQDQLQRDAEAICSMCANPEKWYPAEWETDGGYLHKWKRGGKQEPQWCDATLIWDAWAEAHTPAGRAPEQPGQARGAAVDRQE